MNFRGKMKLNEPGWQTSTELLTVGQAWKAILRRPPGFMKRIFDSSGLTADEEGEGFLRS